MKVTTSELNRAGINLPENYIPTMDDAIAAGDSVLMNEQAALLRECRAALDSLIAQKPRLAGLLCGSTTLGNLKAELGAYRPQGVFGTTTPLKPPLTRDEILKAALYWERKGGSFYQSLGKALIAADKDNLAALLAGFENQIRSVLRYQVEHI